MKPLKTHLLKALANRTKAIAEHEKRIHRQAAIAAAQAELAARKAAGANVAPSGQPPAQPKGHP